MKILFLYCACPYPLGYSQGIGYLSAILKQKGHSTCCLLLTSFEKEKLIGRIENFKPDLIGISLTTDQFELAKVLSEFIYNKYEIPVVMGGAHPTVSPEECLNIKGVLGVLRGEGEFALLDLVSALEANRSYAGIKNFWFKEDGKLIKNVPRPRIENLDNLPFPDRQVQEDFINYGYQAEFMASRGCPFMCSYCINLFLREFYRETNKTFISYRSVDNVLKEISEFVKKYHPKSIVFHDDTFVLNIEWLREFSNRYPQCFDLPIQMNAHPSLITKEAAGLLKKCNVFRAKIGLETGNEDLRKGLLKRNVSNKDIVNAAQLLHNENIEVITFNMIGLPMETSQNIKETINLNKEIMPLSKIGLSMFKPYPGTEIYDYCKNKGLLSDRTTISYFDDTSVLNQKCIDQKTLTYYWKIFRPSVFRNSIFKNIINRIKNKALHLIKAIMAGAVSCGPVSILTLYMAKKIISYATQKMQPRNALRLLFDLENVLDTQINVTAINYEGGNVHPKHRLMRYHDFFVERINPDDTVLDIGCGIGAVANSIAERLRCPVLGIDINPEQIKIARGLWNNPRISFVVGKAPQDIPQRAFSVVVLSNILEHIENRLFFLNEIKQKTNPKKLLIRVPFYQRDWKVSMKKELGISYFNDASHYVEYTEEMLAEELEQAGYVIIDKIIRWGEIWIEAYKQ